MLCSTKNRFFSLVVMNLVTAKGGIIQLYSLMKDKLSEQPQHDPPKYRETEMHVRAK
jgi:hypothetical protein